MHSQFLHPAAESEAACVSQTIMVVVVVVDVDDKPTHTRGLGTDTATLFKIHFLGFQKKKLDKDMEADSLCVSCCSFNLG